MIFTQTDPGHPTEARVHVISSIQQQSHLHFSHSRLTVTVQPFDIQFCTWRYLAPARRATAGELG